jgi:hypothetical protein
MTDNVVPGLKESVAAVTHDEIASLVGVEALREKSGAKIKVTRGMSCE